MGKQWQTLFWAPKSLQMVTDWSHEIKRRLLLGRKVMINLDSMLKSREVTLPTKVHLAKAMVFPVVLYGCESSAIKKVEHQRIDAFELWCWRTLLRVPLIARRSTVYPKGDQSWIFVERTDAEAGTPILWPPDAKKWLIGKDPDSRKDWRREEKGTTENEVVEMASPTQWTWVLSKLGEAWCFAVHGVTKSRHDWVTELIDYAILMVGGVEEASDVWSSQLDVLELVNCRMGVGTEMRKNPSFHQKFLLSVFY